MTLKYVHFFEVTGLRRFPIDMLRYDRCTPVTGEDSFKIEDSHSLSVSRDSRIEHKCVKLMCYTELKRFSPTEGRWRSFGWPVVDGTLETEKL